MSFDQRDNNPFAPPGTFIGATDVDLIETIPEAEQIRRAHIGHEKSIKALGFLQYAGSALFTLGSIALAVVIGGMVLSGRPLGGDGPNQAVQPPDVIVLGLILAMYVFLALLAGAIGFGLRRLQPWSRWTMLALTAISLLITVASGAVILLSGEAVGAGVGIGIGVLIYGYFLYLVASPKAGVVFSREYKAIILQTPYVKNKTSLAVKLIVTALLAAVVLGVIFLATRG